MSLRKSTEHKQKMSAVYSDPERNAKISNSSKGKKGAADGKRWYNDGTVEKYFVEPPDGWHLGRLPKHT